MNNIKNVESITEQELNAGIFGGLSKGSWHEKYKDSAWVFLGGFPFELSEGDIICVMSQWGEIEDINLVRDKVTNKSKGFAFIKYEDNRSTILAVDNFNGTKLLGRILRCDHVEEYRLPKEVREKELEALEDNPDARVEIGPGHAYKNAELADDHNVSKGVDLWKKPLESAPAEEKHSGDDKHKKHKKEKKEKKDHKDKKVKKEKKEKKLKSDRRDSRSDSDSALDDDSRRKYARATARSGRDQESRWQDDRATSATVATAVPIQSAPSAAASTAHSRPGAGSSFSQQYGSSSGGAVASWRGNRDPVAAAPGVSGSSGFGGAKRPYEPSQGSRNGPGAGSSSGSGGGSSASGGSRGYASSNTGGLSGIGGMNRTR